MANIFNSVKVRTPKFNVFNLSHSRKFSCNFSKLLPILCQEIYPGETWSVSTQGFLRFLPLATPMMHHVDVKFWYFFVPHRLIWDKWRDFITYGVNGPDATLAPKFAKPYVDFTKVTVTKETEWKDWCTDGTLMDFLGFPTRPLDDYKKASDTTWGFKHVDLMPFMAYHLIYNEYFINRNVQSNYDALIDGMRAYVGMQIPSKISWLFYLHDVNWNMDYYTSCLPFVQRGTPAPIPFDATSENKVTYKETSDVVSEQRGELYNDDGTLATIQQDEGIISSKKSARVENIDKITTHFTGITATINDLRWAQRLQSWMEKSARVGSRYIEQIKAHFGVTSSDARLQRPELLGAGQFPVVVSDVEQMSSSDQESPQGNLAGKGTGFGITKGWKKHFEEHGFLFGIMVISPRASYKNIWPRQYLRFNPMDYYFPEFQYLGEQAVTKREVSPDMTDEDYNKSLFGYQQRYAEMRYIPSTIHGGFKNSEDLSKWVMVRNLGKVALNNDFVKQSVDYNNFADVTSSSDHCLVELWHDIKATRPLDVYAIPTL